MERGRDGEIEMCVKRVKMGKDHLDQHQEFRTLKVCQDYSIIIII